MLSASQALLRRNPSRTRHRLSSIDPQKAPKPGKLHRSPGIAASTRSKFVDFKAIDGLISAIVMEKSTLDLDFGQAIDPIDRFEPHRDLRITTFLVNEWHRGRGTVAVAVAVAVEEQKRSLEKA